MSKRQMPILRYTDYYSYFCVQTRVLVLLSTADVLVMAQTVFRRFVVPNNSDGME